MEYLDEVKLGFGHNLILGSSPSRLTLKQIGDSVIKEVANHAFEKFGFFDSSAPNYSTYYPEVTAEDLKPAEGDFIEPIFRALSEVIVHKNWNPIDFSEGDILRKSQNLLVGQTINADHETALGNAMGAIKDVEWQASYKDGAIQVPAGINARLKIDGKSNPRIARGIMMDPPSIHSTSVTVSFLWKKSHPEMSEEAFFRGLATYDKDGQLIRRIATKVNAYREISLVGHGADPFAQKVDENGKIVNPVYAATANNSDKAGLIDFRKKEKFFFFDVRTDIISNSENPTIPNESNTEETTENKNTDMNLEQIALALGLPKTATEAEILTALKAIQDANTAQLTEIAGLKEKQPDATKLTDLQSFKDSILANKRAAVTAAYNKTTTTPNAAITAMIASADIPALDALQTEYATKLNELYPATCSKCGSHEISMASSKPKDEGNEGGKVVLTREELREKILSEKRKENLQLMDSSVEPKKD